jgi:oligopeptide/dipeptide ABC transporter ATP-binding protein
MSSLHGGRKTAEPFLEVVNLRKWFPVTGGILGRTRAYVKAVTDVSFDIPNGSTFGLVGESGSGKTTIGRCILRLIEPTSGQVIAEGVDITKLKPKQMKAYRRKLQIIFQDPYASLDPRQTIKSALIEAMRSSGSNPDSQQAFANAKHLIELVGLNEDHLYRFPHEFSGGQRQRIAVARALATNADFLVLDEPTSFLDVSVQAQVLNLLKDLQKELKLTYLFISHNLSVIAHMSDTVGVLYLGKMMEMADTETIYTRPKHPYTHALMQAIPIPDPTFRRQREILKGEVPSLTVLPSGCVFHDRCPYVTEKCKTEEPAFQETAPGHWVSCHYAMELDLKPLTTFRTAGLQAS